MTSALGLFSLFAFISLSSGGLYPKCWIKKGECLDSNVGPLIQAVAPQMNHNIVKNASMGVESLDDCASQCFNETECRYFTYYEKEIPEYLKATNSCLLVGWNLRQACFNLEKTCVMMKECRVLDETCKTCQTGVRPLYDPKSEPKTIVVGGVNDDRDYLTKVGVDQYSTSDALINELFVSAKNKSCTLDRADLKPRFGAAAAFLDGGLYVCGGYDDQDDKYMNMCQNYTQKGMPWSKGDCRPCNSANGIHLKQKRGFHSMVVVEKEDGENVMLALGGYNGDNFLDSIEKYDPTGADGAGAWDIVAGMKMNETRSHFCAVYYRDPRHGKRYLYVIGGWDNKDYSSKVFRMLLNAEGLGETKDWERLDDMKEPRADHACAVVQHFYGINSKTIPPWTTGIMVSGGYRLRGAWTSSVDFLDFRTGKWTSLLFFPRLTQGRHYHGLTTMGLVPTVFGGWNNGSLSSIEGLDYCGSDGPMWKETKNFMLAPREKFAYARTPYDFASDCEGAN